MTDDLAPQQPRPARSPRRKILPAVIATGVLATVVGLVWNLVGGSLFFYNANEAVERRAELGDERFTLQGSPVGCSITEGFQGDVPVVAFSVSFGGEAVEQRKEPQASLKITVGTGDPKLGTYGVVGLVIEF